MSAVASVSAARLDGPRVPAAVIEQAQPDGGEEEHQHGPGQVEHAHGVRAGRGHGGQNRHTRKTVMRQALEDAARPDDARPCSGRPGPPAAGTRCRRPAAGVARRPSSLGADEVGAAGGRELGQHPHRVRQHQPGQRDTPPRNSGTAAAMKDEGEPAFLLVQPGNDERPELVDPDRAGDDQADRKTETWIMKSKELATPSKFRVACRPSCSFRSRIGLISAVEQGLVDDQADHGRPARRRSPT